MKKNILMKLGGIALCLAVLFGISSCATGAGKNTGTNPNAGNKALTYTPEKAQGDISVFNGVWRYATFDSKGELVFNNPIFHIECQNGTLKVVDPDGKVYVTASGTMKDGIVEGQITRNGAAPAAFRLEMMQFEFGYAGRVPNGDVFVLFPYFDDVYLVKAQDMSGNPIKLDGDYIINDKGTKEIMDFGGTSPKRVGHYSYADGVLSTDDGYGGKVSFTEHGFTVQDDKENALITFTRYFDGSWKNSSKGTAPRDAAQLNGIITMQAGNNKYTYIYWYHNGKRCFYNAIPGDRTGGYEGSLLISSLDEFSVNVDPSSARGQMFVSNVRVK